MTSYLLRKYTTHKFMSYSMKINFMKFLFSERTNKEDAVLGREGGM